MTIPEAMTAAIAGGYHIEESDGVTTIYSGANSEYSAWTRTDNQSSFLVPMYEIFLDPAFWQALGQALGWDAPCELILMSRQREALCCRWQGYTWMYHWHCLIQHLAQGGTTDTFFASLPHTAGA